MVSVPTLSDLVTVIYLLLPGFVSIKILKRLAILEFGLSDFDSTIWSLAGSLIIDSIFVAFLNYQGTALTSLADLQVLLIVPQYSIVFLFLAVMGGVIPGSALRLTVRRRIKPGGIWDVLYSEFGKRNARRQETLVTLFTSDHAEYVGAIKSMSKGQGVPKEIMLYKAKRIFRNGSGDIKATMEVGKEVFFKEQSIATIAFYERISP